MKRALILTSFLFWFAALLSAAGITGTWKGAFDFQGTSVPVTLDLKGDGETVSGTVDGLPTPMVQIQDGKLQGEAVSFWITIDYQGQPVKLVYKGKLAGDEIQFTFGTDDGSWGTDLTVKRVT
jgi:hypothetical protein